MKQTNVLETSEVWTSDDWETPDWLAEKMAGLIHPEECRILEPAAGTGQICRAILKRRSNVTNTALAAIEPIRARSLQLPDHFCAVNFWMTFEYYFSKLPKPIESLFDVVVTNPPFSLGMDFLEISMQLITPTGRVLFLLPSDYFQAKARAERLAQIGCSITRVWPIVGRVAYLKDGVPYKNRQCYDSIFEFRHGGCSGIDFIHQ